MKVPTEKEIKKSYLKNALKNAKKKKYLNGHEGRKAWVSMMNLNGVE